MMKEIDDYINYLKDKNYTYETIKLKKTGLNKLNEFLEGNNISVYSINNKVIITFKDYLKVNNFSKSYIANQLKTFKSFIKYLRMQRK